MYVLYVCMCKSMYVCVLYVWVYMGVYINMVTVCIMYGWITVCAWLMKLLLCMYDRDLSFNNITALPSDVDLWAGVNNLQTLYVNEAIS